MSTVGGDADEYVRVSVCFIIPPAAKNRSEWRRRKRRVLQEHFDYDFEDLIQQANTQVESVLSRVHICEQDSANKRQASASPSAGSAGGPVAAAAIAELAEELLMALRDCAALRRCVRFDSLAVRSFTLRDNNQLAKHRGYLARLACDHPSHRPGAQINQTTILSCLVLSGA